jgi:hypothetical protein
MPETVATAYRSYLDEAASALGLPLRSRAAAWRISRFDVLEALVNSMPGKPRGQQEADMGQLTDKRDALALALHAVEAIAASAAERFGLESIPPLG